MNKTLAHLQLAKFCFGNTVIERLPLGNAYIQLQSFVFHLPLVLVVFPLSVSFALSLAGVM